ncbi:MAG: penicillin-binding transpeptidase domain-containing protein [Dialister invisus]
MNAAGQPVNYTGGAAAISGNNIRLTVDSALQRAAENAVEAQVNILHGMGIFPTGASVVAVDPNSGAILAMVSWPSFDPNQFSRGISSRNGIKSSIINHPLQKQKYLFYVSAGINFKVITALRVEAKMVRLKKDI